MPARVGFRGGGTDLGNFNEEFGLPFTNRTLLDRSQSLFGGRIKIPLRRRRVVIVFAPKESCGVAQVFLLQCMGFVLRMPLEEQRQGLTWFEECVCPCVFRARQNRVAASLEVLLANIIPAGVRHTNARCDAGGEFVSRGRVAL